jgi:succinate dehydrogenase / fumarate reductase membrane anchor subunit
MRESKLWSWHILTAVIILILLGLHMGIMHLSTILNALGIGPGESVHSASVFHRSQQIFFMITYILLLGTALFHGLYGLRSMLFELSLSKTTEKTIGGLFAVVGVCLFVYGSYVAIAVFQMREVLP